MALYYAACFPKLSPADLWIKDFRLEFDPKATLVDPHLTVIFPTASFDETTMISEIRRVASVTKRFSVTCRSAILMPEWSESAARGYVFLVPDEGLSDVVKLHDRLYGGTLRSSLRLDIPFFPHVTIGSGLTLEKAKCEVDRINLREIEFSFTVFNISIMAIDCQNSDRRLVESIELIG